MGKGKGRNNPDQDLRYQSAVDRIWHRFSPDELARVCELGEEAFPVAYGMEVVDDLAQRDPNDWFAFKDNGSDILAVAHLDTVSHHGGRRANFVNTEAGWVVYSRALDDRLGAYTILELLPKLGLNFDILLTVGEEEGQSTAAFFETTKQYKWIIEFDRGGTDVVLYQYENADLDARVKASGAKVGDGSYSDISYMSHVGAKGINWGVGYRDYHGPRAHAYIDDYVMMIAQFLEFHYQNQNIRLPHDEKDEYQGWGSGRSKVSSGYGKYNQVAGGWAKQADGEWKWEWSEDDEDEDAAFNRWLKDHAEYTPDATCPGVVPLTDQARAAVDAAVADPVGELIDERLAAIKAEAQQLLPGVDA